ncbi:Ribonuclease R [Andreprevotia sp. IGB-42]|uniref:ribonuclease R n=1 Tax=Andreprevotia sp. IGB-42 TaxID=2497473 RepID=UPI00135AAC1C|nr:ribonuclease R [Andreprevotia sp. IGB-42]KAF0814221.1 Ribonuclease R [Andreprevotia sp. IGB-42]
MSTKKTQNIRPSTRGSKKTSLREQDPWLERERQRYDNPLPSREFILQLLTESGAPFDAAELAKNLSITEAEQPFFDRRLAAMAREGELMINRKGALCLPEKVDSIAGRVQGHKDGFGFLVPDDGSDDLYLGPREMDKVLHGDRALAQQIGLDRRGRREGKIIEVLQRANTRLVGRFHLERGVSIVVAEEKRISQEILIPPGETANAKTGQVVMVEMIQQPERHVKPIGRVVEILGNYDDPGMEIEIALRKHSLPHEFSVEAEAQGRATPKKVRKQDWDPVDGVERVDLTDLPLVTIDGETAKDFDDAVYAEKKGKGWRLVVAIADVSHYVKPDDALDQTSFERGNSVYFPRRVIPMLPEGLSNGICSLMPDVERLCMVCDMQVSASGEIKKYKFYPAVMHSKARLTYTKVWDMISSPEGETAKQYKKLLPHLQTLYALFQTFLTARHERGAIDFETTETEIRFDEVGKIREIVPVVRNDAHKLIEECMLAANVCAANYLIEKKHPVLFRVHEGPNESKLEKLREYLRSCGLSLPGDMDPTAKDYAQLLEQIKLRPDAELLQTMLLRSLSQAVYTPENAGHFGLSYEAYAHFTSPIRRYPDLLLHRAIKAVLAGKKYQPAQKWEQLGQQCSMTERRADEASRDVLNFLKCYFMRDKVGEEFEGTISAVTNFGLFVQLDKLYVEGLVHISELGQDYFHFDDRRHELKGERSGKLYRLTDRVQVRVVRVDMESNKIDFVLVEPQAAATPQQTRAGKQAAIKNAQAEPVEENAAKGRSRSRKGAVQAAQPQAVAEPAPKQRTKRTAEPVKTATAVAKPAPRNASTGNSAAIEQQSSQPAPQPAPQPAGRQRKAKQAEGNGAGGKLATAATTPVAEPVRKSRTGSKPQPQEESQAAPQGTRQKRAVVRQVSALATPPGSNAPVATPASAAAPRPGTRPARQVARLLQTPEAVAAAQVLASAAAEAKANQSPAQPQDKPQDKPSRSRSKAATVQADQTAQPAARSRAARKPAAGAAAAQDGGVADGGAPTAGRRRRRSPGGQG